MLTITLVYYTIKAIPLYIPITVLCTRLPVLHVTGTYSYDNISISLFNVIQLPVLCTLLHIYNIIVYIFYYIIIHICRHMYVHHIHHIYILHNPHISSVRCYPCSWRPPRGVKLQEVHITSLVSFFHIIIVRIIYI